jgi:hypothetical protein
MSVRGPVHKGKRESPWTSNDSGRSLNPLSTVVGVSNGAMFLAQRLSPGEGPALKEQDVNQA